MCANSVEAKPRPSPPQASPPFVLAGIFSSPIAAKIAEDFACAMDQSACKEREMGSSVSVMPRISESNSTSAASTRLSSAATQMSSSELRSDEDGALPHQLKPRKLYPEVLVQTTDVDQHKRPNIPRIAFEALGALAPETSTASVADEAPLTSRDVIETTIAREAESVKKTRHQIEAHHERIDKFAEKNDKLLENIDSQASEFQASYPNTPRESPLSARLHYTQPVYSPRPPYQPAFLPVYQSLPATMVTTYRVHVSRSRSPPVRSETPRRHVVASPRPHHVDSAGLNPLSIEALYRQAHDLSDTCEAITKKFQEAVSGVIAGDHGPATPEPENIPDLEECRMNEVRSGLSQALAEAQSTASGQTDMSILTAGKETLQAALDYAKEQGLAHEELQPAELQRRKMHNAVQDLKGQVRVFCRVRPLNELEKEQGDTCNLQFPESDCVLSPQVGRLFFNSVFAPGSQAEVFDNCRDLVQSAVDGHNVTIFSYGPTGTGKTYTMYGTPAEEGIAGRMVEELFDIINSLQRSSTVSVEGSIAEIYNSRLIDLLKPITLEGKEGQQRRQGVRPKLCQSKEGDLEMYDLSRWQISDMQQLKEMIDHGFTQRSVAETALNTCSSRSHLILTIKLARTNACGETLTGKLVFCDLGGSERLKRTEAVGDRKQEAIEINKSLSALGDVIQAVASKRKHVPYRNHALTRVLQDSLGGTAKTLMFMHCSPALSCAGETAMTLNFADRAGRIVNSGAPVPHTSRSHSNSA